MLSEIYDIANLEVRDSFQKSSEHNIPGPSMCSIEHEQSQKDNKTNETNPIAYEKQDYYEQIDSKHFDETGRDLPQIRENNISVEPACRHHSTVYETHKKVPTQ